jgi:hypothetical protein
MVEVKMYAQSIRGSGRVTFGEPNSVLFVSFLELDGVEQYTEGEVKLTTGGSEGFLMLELHRPTPERLRWLDKYSGQSTWRKRGYDTIRARYTDPEQYMEGTGPDVLILAVSKLSFVESITYERRSIDPNGISPNLSAA